MSAVQFSDGTSHEFGEKAKVKKVVEVTDTSASVKFYFANGQLRTFACPETLVLRAAAHGLSQKIGDAFAGVASTDDCVQAFDEMAERLANGEWNAEREVAAGASGASVLARAIAEHTGKPIEQVREKLKTIPAKAKLQLRASPTLRPIIERMEAEKVRKGEPVDTEALLAQMA